MKELEFKPLNYYHKQQKADIGLGRAIDIMACHRRIRPRENNVVDEMNTYNRTISMHKSKDKK